MLTLIWKYKVVGLTSNDNECKLWSRWSVDLDRLNSRQNKSPVRFSLRGLKLKIYYHIKSCRISSLSWKKFEASLRMGIYKDWQIHTKTGFRPIKMQESRSGPHTNRMPYNSNGLLTGVRGSYWEIQDCGLRTARACEGCAERPRSCISQYGTSKPG